MKRRKLIAVLHADMVGYSNLLGLDDVGTLERLRALRAKVIDPTITEHGGRIVHSGTYDELLTNPNSLTGAYLSGKEEIEVPAISRSSTSCTCTAQPPSNTTTTNSFSPRRSHHYCRLPSRQPRTHRHSVSLDWSPAGPLRRCRRILESRKLLMAAAAGRIPAAAPEAAAPDRRKWSAAGRSRRAGPCRGTRRTADSHHDPARS